METKLYQIHTNFECVLILFVKERLMARGFLPVPCIRGHGVSILPLKAGRKDAIALRAALVRAAFSAFQTYQLATGRLHCGAVKGIT